MGNWVLSTVSLAIGLVGATFAFIAYFKPPKRIRLAYQTSSTRYFAEEDYRLPREVVMTFKGEKVERLSKTTTVFWNTGTEVLRGEDIVQSDSIRVCLDENDRILSYLVAGSTRDANLVRATQIEGVIHELNLSYEYLDPGDGFVLEIMHDSKRRLPLVKGTAKGLSDGPESRGTLNPDDVLSLTARTLMLPRRLPRILMFVMLIVGAVALLVGAIGLLLPAVVDLTSGWMHSIAVSCARELPRATASSMVGVGIAYLLLPTLFFWVSRRRFPKSLTKHLHKGAGEDAELQDSPDGEQSL